MTELENLRYVDMKWEQEAEPETLDRMARVVGCVIKNREQKGFLRGQFPPITFMMALDD